MNAIEIDNISFSYDKINVLDCISLSVKRGDYVGIIGSNGAGKSTLLKLMLGIIKPDSGTIRLFGTELSKWKDLHEIGYIPQNSASLAAGFPATVTEIVKANLFSQIGFLRFPKKKHMGQVQRALELVGMQEYSGRLIGELSGGQQQRVMLARVLAGNPKLLLLDEPTTGIDEAAAEELYTLLERLNRDEGITVVMVTHDVRRAAQSAKRILHMDGHEVREETKHDTAI